MKLSLICKQIATLGPIGYLPAPGTCGTFASMFLVMGAAYLGISTMQLTIALCIIYVVAHACVVRALEHFSDRDPQQIIIDELIGYTFVTLFFARTPFNLFLAACVFRFFDIAKPLGVGRVQELDGADGIILDDVMAGVYSIVALVLLGVGAN